jgi:hypothetical protein
MPKVRDLGISFIPATMRPPEVGGGAAPPCEPPSFRTCDPSGCDKEPSCFEPSFATCDPSGCDKPPSCVEPSTKDCPGNSRMDCDDPSGCDKGASCVEPSTGQDRPRGGGLSAVAIAELRQQMQQHLGA